MCGKGASEWMVARLLFAEKKNGKGFVGRGHDDGGV